MGIANANVAEMVVHDINAGGGLLGRPLRAHRRGQRHRRRRPPRPPPRGWSTSTTSTSCSVASTARRGRRSRAPSSSAGRKLYIYPEQYEGQECDPLIFCTGPVPAQQIEPLFPWLMEHTGARTFYLPSADYIWPHVLNEKVREVVTARGGTIVGEEYHPLDHMDYDATVERIMASGADVVFNTIVPPGLTPFLAQLYEAGFTKRGGHIVCTYFDENFLNLVPAEHVEGLYGCLDYYRDGRRSVQHARCVAASTTGAIPGSAQFTAGSACTGMYRGLRLWAAAVTEAGSLDTDAVVKALDTREHRRRTRRSGRDGPRPAPPAAEHVHRAGTRRCVRGRREPRPRRPQGGRRRVGPNDVRVAAFRPVWEAATCAVQRLLRTGRGLLACRGVDQEETIRGPS